MRYAIFENGEEINVIEADEAFVTDYCEQNGYTYQEAPLPEPVPEPEEESSVWDELDAAYQEGYSEGYTEGVNGAYDQ